MAIKSIADIVKRIKALREKTVDRGASEAEAAAAAKMAGRMMDKYQLKISDIEVKQSEAVKEYLDLEGKARDPITSASMGVADYCDVETWRDLDRSKNNVCFFGLPHDVEMAQYLMEVIIGASKAEYARFKKTKTYQHQIASGANGRTIRHSFIHGMCTRLNHRLRELKAERLKTEGGKHSNALVPVKNAVIRAAMAEEGINLRHTKSRSNLNAAGYEAGVKAGNRVNLGRAVNGGTNTRQIQ